MDVQLLKQDVIFLYMIERPGMRGALVAGGLAVGGGLAAERLSHKGNDTEKPTTEVVEQDDHNDTENESQPRRDSSEDQLTIEERVDRANDFVDGLEEHLENTNYQDYSAEIQPDGRVVLTAPGEHMVRVQLAPQKDGRWLATLDQPVMNWLVENGVTPQSFDMAQPDQIITAMQDAEAIQDLYAQAAWIQSDEGGFGSMFSDRMSEDLSATEQAEAKAAQLQETEKRKNDLAADIRFALEEGDNVYAKE
jgi:hypothetical protein